MKKITLCLMFAMLGVFTFNSYAQTLNQNAGWPNTNWALTGTYNTDPLVLEADPTLTPNFAFDDNDTGNSTNTSDDDIAAESPIIDLTAAHTAGETWITISGNFVYNKHINSILQFEYWDADANSWNIIGSPFNTDTAGAPFDNFCSGTTEAYTTDVLNIVEFTPTQLSGFRYRIYFNDDIDGMGWTYGFCFDSPTIISTTPPSCPDPSALMIANLTETTVDLSWTENGVATSWNVEIVDVTAGGAQTMTATTTGVTNPYTTTGLVADNVYEFYVQVNCEAVEASWVGPFAFVTPYVTVPPDCTNGTFLDSGGINRNYSNGENITYTITPDTAGDVVSVYFSFFSTEENDVLGGCYDGLTIYNGADTTAVIIDPPGGGTIWCWDRNDAIPDGTGDLQGMTITSTDPSGALTFVFTSDMSAIQREGWEATVYCNTLTTQNLDNGLAFNYYPNPIKETLFLQAQKNIEKVSVYNMLGQEILRNTPNSLEENLDLSALQTGIYFVKVKIDNTTETVRIIKN